MFQVQNIWDELGIWCPECNHSYAYLKEDEEPKVEYPILEPSERDVLLLGKVTHAEILRLRGTNWANRPGVLDWVVKCNTPNMFHYLVEQGCVPRKDDLSLLKAALENEWHPEMIDVLLPYLQLPSPDDKFYYELAEEPTFRKMVFISQHAKQDEYGRYFKIDELWEYLFDGGENFYQKAVVLLAGGANPGGNVDLGKLHISPHCLIARYNSASDFSAVDWTTTPKDSGNTWAYQGINYLWPYKKNLEKLPAELRQFNLFYFWRLQISVLLLYNHLIPTRKEGGLKDNLERLFAMSVNEAEAYCGLSASIWNEDLIAFVTEEYRQVFLKIRDFLIAPI